MEEKIVLYARSKEGDADWYGDFNYLENPLEKYHESKMCHVEYDRGSSHGYGIAGITVTTSKDFLEMMGWEDDLKYQIKK
jgi:hypothetical protein